MPDLHGGLDEHFEAGRDPFESFRENQAMIEQQAINLILSDCFEDDSSIFIRASSFRTRQADAGRHYRPTQP
jgi:hypothetical protein